MKKILLLCSLLACSLGVSYAQTTAVTATVVDSDGTTWANGKWSIAWTPGPSNPNINAYTNNGAPLSNSVAYQSGTLNGSGALSVTVYDSSVTFPTGSGWALSVCSNTSAPCSVYNFSTAGGSQDISAALTTNIAAPRFKAVSGTYGYVDTEATLSVSTGATYWNVTSGLSRCYTGSVWGACSTSGGNATTVNGAAVPASQGCVGTNSGSQFIPGTCTGGGGAGTAYNPNVYYVYGDSISNGGTVVTPSNAYDARIAAFLGIASSTRRSFSGDVTCAWSARILALDSPGTLAQQPLRTFLYGTNDANAKGSGAYENVFKACHQAGITWLTTPLAFKVMAPSATAAGTCATDTTYTPTNGEICTANASTITFSGGSALATTGKPIYIWYRSIDGDTGTWTYSIDGGGAVAVSTASTPAIAGPNSITTAIMVIRVPVSAGTHSIAFTQTGAGSMSILGVGTPSNNTSTGALPYLVVGELPNQYNGNIQSTVNAYRADTDANVSLLTGDGLQAILAPTGSYVQMTAAAADSNFPTDSIHPNDIGHAELAAAFLSAINLKFQGNVPASTLTLTPVVLNTGISHTVVATDGVIFSLNTGNTIAFPASGLPLGTTVHIYANSITTLSGLAGNPITTMPAGSGLVVSQDNTLGQWWIHGSYGTSLTNFVLNPPVFSCSAHTVTMADNVLFCNNTNTVTFPATGMPLGKTVFIASNGGVTTLSGVIGTSTIPLGGGAVVSQLNSVGQWWVVSVTPGISIPAGTATFTAGTNVTSCGCASTFSCNNTRGRLTIVGGTATTGTICTVNFSAALAAAPTTTVNEMGATALHGLDHGLPTTTAFIITAASTVTGATMTVDYSVLP